MKNRGWLPLVAAMALVACVQEQTAETDSAAAVESLRFVVARFQHEACTFCPGGDVTIESARPIVATPC